MNKLINRTSNKIHRTYGELVCHLFQHRNQEKDCLIHNTFPVGDGVAEIRYRARNEGDWGAVHQVFHCMDYRIDIWPQGKALLDFYVRNSKEKQLLIIDAGANIGASSVYFSTAYPDCKVLAIEPEKHNCNMLRMNSRGMPIEIYEAALGNKPGKLYLQDPGRSSWGFRVGEQGEYQVDVVTIEELIEKAGNNALPFILKIDIEGGEQALFETESEWLNWFGLVVIELHDWMLPGSGSSNNFIRNLARHNFDILHRGENLFCFNNSILGSCY